MKKKLLIFFLGTSGFFSFVFFSYLVHKNLFTRFDFDTTVILQDHLSRGFDDLFSYLSVVGRFEIVALFLLLILIIRRKLRGIIVLLFFVGFHILEIYGKVFLQQLPPPHFMLRTKTIGNFPQFYVSTENSYPSGHAARAAFVTVVFLLFVMRSKKIGRLGKLGIIGVIFLYDGVMLVSRVYLGEHWASDVIGGTLLGISMGLLGVAVF